MPRPTRPGGARSRWSARPPPSSAGGESFTPFNVGRYLTLGEENPNSVRSCLRLGARQCPRRAHRADPRGVGGDQPRLARASATGPARAAPRRRSTWSRRSRPRPAASKARSARMLRKRGLLVPASRIGDRARRQHGAAARRQILSAAAARARRSAARSTATSGRRSSTPSRREPPIATSTRTRSSPGWSPTCWSSAARCRARSSPRRRDGRPARRARRPSGPPGRGRPAGPPARARAARRSTSRRCSGRRAAPVPQAYSSPTMPRSTGRSPSSSGSADAARASNTTPAIIIRSRPGG